VRGKDDGMVVSGGSGYCIEIRKDAEGKEIYLLSFVTEDSLKGSVAVKNCIYIQAILKNFTYTGDEEL
jgi:hypothetical protein